MGSLKNNPNASSSVIDLPSKENIETTDEIAQRYKEQFRRLTPAVRQLLVRDLPSYNQLIDLNMQEMTFEELALMELAKERGEFYDYQNPPTPACPHCGSINIKKRTDKDNLYYCNDCEHSSAASIYNSVAWKTKVDLLTWTKLFNALLSYQTVADTCEICGIAPETYVRMRNCAFYLAELYMKDLRLSGNIQCDETYCRISYRGSSLKLNQFDEDDIRFSDRFVPRSAKQRGGAAKHRNQNQIAIFCAIDSFNNVYCCYSGVGNPSFKGFKKHVPAERFLPNVPNNPKQIPHAVHAPKESDAKPGDESLFICDGSKALVKYATDVLGMKPYSRVFRKDGKQLKTSQKEKYLNNQKINNVHRRLQAHLSRTGFSSRYLRGQLAWFNLLVNTDAQHNREKVVGELLKLLVKPNLGQTEHFYESVASLPNYVFEWFDEDNSLQKVGFSSAYAFFLYDQYKHPEDYPGREIPTLNEVSEWSGLSLPHIRNQYANLLKNGYREKIKKFFQNDKALKVRKESANIDPVLLAIYKGYAETRGLPFSQRPTFEDVFKKVLEEHAAAGTVSEQYTAKKAKARIDYLMYSGHLAPYPKVKTAETIAGTYAVETSAIELLKEYDSYIADHMARGELRPSDRVVKKVLQERHPEYAASTITRYLQRARALREQQGQSTEYGKERAHKRAAVEVLFDEFMDYTCDNRPDSKAEDAFLCERIIAHRLNLGVPFLQKQFSELLKNGTKDSFPSRIRAIAEKRFPMIDIEQLTIKELREATGMSQAHFAEYFELSVRTLQKWERNQNEVNKRTLRWLINTTEKQGLFLQDGLISAIQFSKKTGILRKNVMDYIERYQVELKGHICQTSAFGWMLDETARQFIVNKRAAYMKKSGAAGK